MTTATAHTFETMASLLARCEFAEEELALLRQQTDAVVTAVQGERDAAETERDRLRAVVQQTVDYIGYRLGPARTLEDIERFCKAALEPTDAH